MLAARRRLVKIVDHVLDSLQDVPSSLSWARELAGGLQPVEPTTDVTLTVKFGELPSDLSGAFMRIGPNTQFWPPRKRTHAFDGDGMLHVVRIVDGTATYHCDYMHAPRFEIEKELGEEWFVRIGELSGFTGLAKAAMLMGSKAKLYGLQNWEASTPNTAVAITPQGHLWALNEGGAPYRFRLGVRGEPISVGYDTQLGSHEAACSAHPKFDPQTGETFFHGKSMQPKRYFVARCVDGKVAELADLPNMRQGFQHDMFITQNFICVIDGSMLFAPKNLVSGGPLWNFNPKTPLRFGIHPRSGGKLSADGFIWIDAPFPADIVHTLHAYDEGGKIILWAPLFEQGDSQGILGDMGPIHMRRLVIDVEKRSVEMEKVPGGEDFATDFPKIREDRSAQKVGCGYSGVISPGPEFNFTGILKWNLESPNIGPSVIHFPDGVVGGEPVFFPRTGSSPDPRGDDGYVGLFLWNTVMKESTFAVYDARSFSSTPIVELAVPCRVPLGFHASFITEEEFQKQLTA
jgi:carotenoid cleavage dioxygenase